MNKILITISSLFLLAACTNNDKPEIDDSLILEAIAVPTLLPYTIVNVYPHDTSAYTQGLELHNGKLYEGTGDFKSSSLRIADATTGKVEKKYMMGADSIFGEGITVFKDNIYQLTWTSNIVYVYDIKNIEKPIKTLKWPYEGWGITNNGTDLIVSDGSANLYFVDAVSFKVKSSKQIRDNNGPVEKINELEYADGFIYANVYLENYIVKIDPSSGHVVGKIDLAGLLEQYAGKEIISGRTDVLNGIAYDSAAKKFYITGKRWPKLFEIKLN
jgi:glutamine cyclotransferase